MALTLSSRGGSVAWGGAGALVALAVATVPSGCGSSDARDFYVVQYDAGSDIDEGGRPDAEPEVDPTLGGPCSEDTQCDDLIPCTFDACDKSISRCRNTPDDTQCADAEYCNGQERCKLRRGCVAGPVVSCQDSDGCTIDRCVEATKSCEHVPRDVDGDGDPDDHCYPKKDCDDTDPTVSSTRAEICGNFKDDNCNGEVDEQPCAIAANDACSTALAVTAPGTFLLSTIASKKDYTTSCSVAKPAAAQDIVLAITVPAEGGPRDVLVGTRTSAPSNEVAVAMQRTCGAIDSEVGCGHIANRPDARAIARSVAPGSTVYAVVTTQAESAVDVKVDFLAPTTRPTNESCEAPQPAPVDVAFSVSLIDPIKDLASSCDVANTGDLTYAFTLTEPHDVRIFASTLYGSGVPIVSMRYSTCVDELRCRVANSPPLFARNLPAGTHVFSVAGTSQIDASLLVKTYPPTPTPANQTCTNPPTIEANTQLTVNLAGQEDAIKNGCMSGRPNAAYRLPIIEPSDVLVVGRFPLTEPGAVSLNTAACGTADRLACSIGGSPIRVSARNLPGGDYRVVIADENGFSTDLMALVRPTIPPVTVTSDTCTDAVVVIPENGGFFAGDTTTATANFNAGCDAPSQPNGGAKDHLLRLNLTEKKRVIFDMTGSALTTVLDVRSGDACPGTEVAGGCSPGYGPDRSFLDLTLTPGTYWVQVDGYSGAVGRWNLDVRVIAP